MWSGQQIDTGPIIAYAVAFFTVLAPPALALVGGVAIFGMITFTVQAMIKRWRNP